MALDPEVTDTLNHFADRIEKKIDTTGREGAVNARRIEDKVDHLNVQFAEATGTLEAHIKQDDDRFDKTDDSVKEARKLAEKNGIGMAKLTGTAAGGGGLIAGIIEFLRWNQT